MVVVLTVLVVLAVVLLGAGGLYFAGQIHSDGLFADQKAEAQVYDLVVVRYSAGRVVLRRAGDHPDALGIADTYGLRWPGGRGLLSGPLEMTAGTASKALEVTTGSPPGPGTKAALDRDVWTDPRAAYGVEYRNVSYPCAGGSCPAWFVPGRSSTWIVLVHGKGGSRTEPLRAMGPALQAGMPALDITYRNDPGAPADPSHQYGYGVTEWHDLEAAVRYATDHGARDVVLFGSSMGGSIVASFLEHSAVASVVRGVILDAPALDFRATVEFEAAHRTLPVLGTPIPNVLTGTAEWIAGWRYDVDWAAMDYLTGNWLHVPALVVHGVDDATVPIASSDEFADAHRDLVQQVRVRGADHVESWNIDPRGYTGREAAFLGCVTAARPAPSCPTRG
ncbi:MAG: Dipeptidylaminopeptidase/acylaminoacyl-peptidase-like protein [Blastococcus sp.]|nr:Dipeptidylaminopeptidase/acylaminoacyl-peptidase-like protein [Blastococcus sp.]